MGPQGFIDKLHGNYIRIVASVTSKPGAIPAMDDLGKLDISTMAQEVHDLIAEMKAIGITKFKELIYNVTGNLETLNIWEDDTLTLKLYQTDYTYTGDNLTLITVLRIEDGLSYTKTLDYDVTGNLVSIDVVLL